MGIAVESRRIGERAQLGACHLTKIKQIMFVTVLLYRAGKGEQAGAILLPRANPLLV